ncbi:hypothetical protein [Rugamonas rivuli]|uniref:Uncharacterized protein n=1 Tax=Rugamonas rivuli TaxID=2743358 RepID=A0A843S7R8_9BURK|nr:hypothetical protein [Rugamonas rivuli]MQA18802.1 hypothetical protein [Rugamonas rivuli]
MPASASSRGATLPLNALQTGSTYASQVAGITENDSSMTYKTSQVTSSGDLAMVAGQGIKLSGTQVVISMENKRENYLRYMWEIFGK